MRKLAVFLITGALLLGVGCSAGDTKTSAPSATPIVIEQTIDAFGIVKSNDVKDILIDFPASIEEIHIKDGQKIKKGDSLFTLNFDEYSNQIGSKVIELDTTKLEYQNTRLELEKLKTDLTNLQRDLANQSHPDLRRLLNDLRNAEKIYNDSVEELKSKEALFKSGSLSQFDLDSFDKNVDANKKAVDDAKSAIEITRYNISKEINQLKLAYDQKAASIVGSGSTNIYDQKISALESSIQLMNDKINKSYMSKNSIVSDMENAIVYDLGYVKGEALTPAKKLLSLMSLNSIIVEASIPEEFIRDVKIGSEVVIIPQADKSKKYTGKITYIANKAVQRNGETTVLVQASIENNDGFLLPDFNVNLEISMK